MEDRIILEQFPLPLARGYRRYLNAPESKERHDHGYFLFEIYLKYVSATAIAAYLASPERDHRVNAVLKGLLRPSLGEWLRFLRECLEFADRREDSDPVTRSIVALFKAKDARAPRCLLLFNRMRSFRTDQRSEKEAITLGGLLEELVAFRNRALGHGAPLDREHYRAFGDLFGPAFAELLDRSPFLTARRLVSFDSTRVEEGSWVECAVIEFMGNQPVRRQKPHRIRYGEPVPTENLLYLLGDGVAGEGAGLLVLDPLLVAHREDVYILNEAQGAPEYLSYSTGEHHRPSDLGGKQGELFEKILGYRVDETRMSQMGDELASTAEKAASVDLKDGEKRLGDYRIVREVGRGAMGTVFEAFQESLGRRVALKVLPGTFALDQRRLERFRREARATARIHHANIVPVYEVGEADGNHFYSMEFIDGHSLDKLLEDARKTASGGSARKSSTSDPAYIAAAVEQIAALAEGLHQAHHLGLIHRDVKPSNILVNSSGGFVLVDFGLVHEEEAGTLTRSGELVGTLCYMSPEQLSRRQVDARSDVYSLGATLYEVLTLSPPFGGESDHQVQNGILFEEPAPLRRLNPRLNRDLETIVLHALEKNPDRRYASAAELAADLRRFIRYEPIRARPISIFGKLVRRAGRHRTALAAGAVILVLLVSVGGLLLKTGREERARLLAEYEPRVTRAVMKTQLGRLGQLSGSGDALPLSAERLPGVEDVRADGRGAGLETLEDALRELDAAVALAPGRPDAHFHRAKVLLLIHRVLEARGACERALDCDPSFVPARILRAEILRREGDTEGARRELAAAESSTGKEWAGAWLSAHQAVLERDWGKAAEAYTELIESGPGREPYLGSDIEARLGRALAYLEGDEFHRAIQDLVAARTLWPEAPEPQLLLGKAYYLKGEDAAAEETFRELHRRSPFPDQAALAVAAVYASAENREAALEWVEARVKSPLERERGRSLYLNGLDRPEEAERAARVAVGLQPRDTESLRQLGWSLVAQEKYPEQVQLFREVLEKNPEDLELRELLVWALFANRDFDAAETVCRVGLGLQGGNPRLMTILGRVLLDQGKAEAAIEQFQKAIQVDPTDYSPYGAWQELLSRAERHKEASEKIHEYLRGNPHALPSSWLFVDLALNYAQLGDHARAFVAWSELVERFGDHWALEPLVGPLRLADATPEVTAWMDRLITKLERVPEPRRTARLLNALAALFLYHPEKRNAGKALDYASSAIRRAKVKHPDLLATLAEAKFLTGEKNEAVAILEDAAGLPGAGQFVMNKLKEYLSQIPGAPPETPGNEPGDASAALPPVLLAASPFRHPDRGVQHLRTRWQLRGSGGDGAQPAIDHLSKTDRESWAVPEGLLLPRTTYSWRVSYTGSNFSSSSPSAETSFRTADFPWEAAPFDLSGQFNRDVVADSGDGQNDSLDSGGGLLVVEEFHGKPAEKLRVQGLPGDRRIGVHVLGEYAGKNAIQLSSLNRGSVRIPVPQGSYSAVRFLVAGGHGDSLVPLVLEYADGTTEETSLPCDDWFDDSPVEGKIEWVGVLQPGVVPALNGMDRNYGGFFQDSNDPAIFEIVRVARPDKVLRALLLEPGRGLFTRTTGAPTRFNLLAATGIRAIGK